jgi:cytochrome P450
LASRPECLERVRREIDTVLGDAPMNHSDVPRLEYTTRVIQEGLRLYPPFWMIDRMAVADDRVGDIEIPAGSMVIVYVYGAHHAPAHWQNPEAFDTDRFIKGSEKLRTPFTYIPFGAGPRGCIGSHYAMLQILMVVSDLLRKYDFQLVPDQTIEARPMVILRPKHGIRMTFTNAVASAVSDQNKILAPS